MHEVSTMRFNSQFISSVIPDSECSGTEPQDFSGFSIDSRELEKGEIFVAIKGNNDDGHNYLAEAIKKGASGIMVNATSKDLLKKLETKKLFVITVPETKQALIRLAATWREQFTYPVIGITGSIGKTSTKEMLANIVRANNMQLMASQGTQNTVLGCALNIFRMKPEHAVAIFEMGINKRGEMAKMAELVKPTNAVITTIGHCHMEGLGSLSDIASEKRDIFKFFKEDNIGVINGDLPILANISYKHPIVKFGCKTTNQVQGRKIQTNTADTNFILKLYKERLKINLKTNHAGHVLNALAAASAAYLLNIPTEAIIKGIEQPLMISGRYESTKLKKEKGILINDAYNASPESMKAALLAFEKLESKGQKIAVLGDMLELGVNSPFWHRQLGRFLRKVPSLHHVILVGDLVKWTTDTIPVNITFEHVPTWKEAITSLQKRLDREAVILVKGSRGVQLNRLVGELSEKQK